VVNLIAPLIGALYGAWIMSVQFSDYAADNNNMGFTDSLAQLKKKPLAFNGLRRNDKFGHGNTAS
jgi:CysZ protein